ncbi:malonyl-CoA O-methyltransferase [Pseudoalteromonas ulvae UL12]|uniref:Methyltransferase type 11 domain-containing protein n=1 Tax=Pseudoalteromonas ulvae TaxID=107327 RepID=A0A244CMA0_PSEDV|nr:methyltransferase domain-containing protein [Pseudoalteromonas ulvae]MBE0363984.1 malonyl-CoA O-methyltransferase [Pseudoalteromonas ulvae UL12]OUL56761.1 hypothetical protein B1199_15415 [Pseudoalteromonas ulvae]
MSAVVINTQKLKAQTQLKFSNAAANYAHNAQVQQQSSQQLFEFVQSHPTGICLDLGSGPGVNCDMLRTYFPHVIAMDLSFNMLSTFEQGIEVTRCCADMDSLPFQSSSLEAVFSNFASQWSSDFSSLINELYRVLKPGGRVYLTNVLSGSLDEIRMAWQAIDSEPHINEFLSVEHFYAIAEQSAFNVKHLDHQVHQQYFVRPIDALRSIKAIGANTKLSHASSGLMGKQQYQNLLQAYPATDRGCAVSYHVGYMVLEK